MLKFFKARLMLRHPAPPTAAAQAPRHLRSAGPGAVQAGTVPQSLPTYPQRHSVIVAHLLSFQIPSCPINCLPVFIVHSLPTL